MSNDSQVVQLGCPACGGMLPVPSAGTDYLACPYCSSSLYLRRSGSGLNLELAKAIGEAVGQEIDQRFLQQQLQLYRMHAEQAQAQGLTRVAVQNWLAAYELQPSYGPATHWLDSFIAHHGQQLIGPYWPRVPNLTPADRDALAVLNDNPENQPPATAAAPEVPPPLGQVSMRILRTILPARAAAVEQIHAQRMAAYEQVAATHQQEQTRRTRDWKHTVADWRERAQAIRANRALMARLCLALVEAQQHEAAEAEQRRQAEAAAAQQRQLADMQRQLQQLNSQRQQRR